MRVLHVMASGARGGGADHLLGLLPALADAGVECSAAVGDDGPLAERLAGKKVPVRTIRVMHSRLNPMNVRRIAMSRSNEPSDIVHYHGTRAAFFGALGNLRGAPSVYTVHGLSYRQKVSRGRHAVLLAAEWVACRRAKKVVSVSRTDLDDLVSRGLVGARQGCHIPNCVDAERFQPGNQLEARRASGLPATGVLVGTLSRLVPQKAVHDLISAVERCADVTLCIAGDGPLRGELESRAAPLGGRVQFLGSRDDIPTLLRAWDIFALASQWEGEPIALLEAMAAGLPCVATDTEGAREILGGGISLEPGAEAGLIVPRGEPAAMADVWSALCSDPERRISLGQRARAAVLPRRYEAAAKRLIDIYEEVLRD